MKYSHYLSSEPDQHTKLAFSCANDLEALRINVEWGYVMLRLQSAIVKNSFPSSSDYPLSSSCHLLFGSGYNVILIHNMMIEARLDNDEVECAAMCNILARVEEQVQKWIVRK